MEGTIGKNDPLICKGGLLIPGEIDSSEKTSLDHTEWAALLKKLDETSLDELRKSRGEVKSGAVCRAFVDIHGHVVWVGKHQDNNYIGVDKNGKKNTFLTSALSVQTRSFGWE